MDAHLRSIDGPVAFDRYVLDPLERRLSRDGESLALPSRAFELLTTLIAHRGEALSREELYELLWPGGSVEDANLSQNIYLLRRALDPGGDGRRFIQTLPRHGYRFAVPVRRIRTRGQTRALLRMRAIHVAVAACLCALTLLVAGSAVRSMDVPLPHSAAVSYALGVYHWNMRTPAQLERSIGYFASTVREAPQSALGYAGLADAYAIEADDTDAHSRLQKHYLRLAEHNRDAALARDPNSAEAHTVTAFLAERFYGDIPRAEREFRAALTTNPGYATAHHWHAIVRFSDGDIQGAVREWELAHQLEPTSEVISRWLGIGYFYERRYGSAVSMLSETLDLQPDDVEAWIQLASAQELRGQFSSAQSDLEHARRVMPHKGPYVELLEARVKAVANHGEVDSATMAQVRRLVKTNRVAGAELAYFFAALGQRDTAIALLSRDVSNHDSRIDRTMQKYDPRFDSLRNDPRFKKIFG